MTIESATHIDDLNATYPESNTSAGDGDDHLRLIKSVLLTDFAGIGGAVTATHTELNYLDITTLGTAAASKALVADGSANINANAITWTDLGTVTTVDINGGTIDAASIGATTPAAGAFTTLSASSTLAVTGASTLTGAVTAGTSLALASGATVTEFSTDGTLAGNSDTAVPTEKAVKTYADSLDFATESYVDARAYVQISCDVAVSTNAENLRLICGVTGTITRVDAAWLYTGADSSTVTVTNASDAAIATLTAGAGASGSDSETSPTNTSVSPGDVIKVGLSALSTQTGHMGLTITIQM